MLEQIRWTQAEYELLREEILKRARAEGRSVELPEAVTLFRLPYGRCTDKALALLAREGLQVIQWSVIAETPQDNAVHGMGARVAGQVRPVPQPEGYLTAVRIAANGRQRTRRLRNRRVG